MVNVFGYQLTNQQLMIIAAVALVVIYFYRNHQLELFESEMKEGAPKRTLVLFYAPWCPHCKDIMPNWDALSKKHANDPSLKVQKVDCDAHPEQAKKNKVEGYPTIILFKDGKKIVYESGARDVKSLEHFAMS